MPKHSEDQPSRNEEEYFARKDAELIKSMRAKLDREREETERKAHYMKCPKCGTDLAEESRGDVKVDTCSRCGGMWLDAGELELMRQVEKSAKPGAFKGLLDFFPSKASSRK